jgi:hypothetical protein
MEAGAAVHVNTLTAAPLLRLLLALEGMEPPLVIPAGAWAVFKRYARMPSAADDDAVGFLARWVEEPGNEPVVFCVLERRLTDAAGNPLGMTRTVQLEYTYDAEDASDLEDIEIWSDEFESLDDFFQEVEDLPQFELMQSAPVLTCDLYTEESVLGL